MPYRGLIERCQSCPTTRRFVTSRTNPHRVESKQGASDQLHLQAFRDRHQRSAGVHFSPADDDTCAAHTDFIADTPISFTAHSISHSD